MKFNLQQASFSDSEEQQNELRPLTTEMINKYNRQYSMIVSQVQNFLKQTKQSVERFLTFHNFGANLCLPRLFQTLINVEDIFKKRLVENSDHSQKKNNIKQKYQNNFNKILDKIGELLTDLLDCQLEFKKNFLQIKTENRSRSNSSAYRHNVFAQSISSVTKSSKSINFGKSLKDIEQYQKEEINREAELRKTLNEKLKPKQTKITSECKQSYSTTENLYRLNEKLDRIVGDMKLTRTRQQKMIQLFNLNRVKHLHGHNDQYNVIFPKNQSSIKGSTECQDEMDNILNNWKKTRKHSDLMSEYIGTTEKIDFTKKELEPNRFI